MLISYAQVYTDQDLALPRDALRKAGCQRTLTDKTSGTKSDRPDSPRLSPTCARRTSLVVWKLVRLGRTVKGLVDLVGALSGCGVQFRRLTDGIDTTTAGRLFFHGVVSLVQMKRELIGERAEVGLAPARKRGRVGGRNRRMIPGQVDSARPLLAGDIPPGDVARTRGISIATLYRWVPAASRSQYVMRMSVNVKMSSGALPTTCFVAKPG